MGLGFLRRIFLVNPLILVLMMGLVSLFFLTVGGCLDEESILFAYNREDEVWIGQLVLGVLDNGSVIGRIGECCVGVTVHERYLGRLGIDERGSFRQGSSSRQRSWRKALSHDEDVGGLGGEVQVSAFISTLILLYVFSLYCAPGSFTVLESYNRCR
jgi:hypothetical protein